MAASENQYQYKIEFFDGDLKWLKTTNLLLPSGTTENYWHYG